jgi:hypothetical protein
MERDPRKVGFSQLDAIGRGVDGGDGIIVIAHNHCVRSVSATQFEHTPFPSGPRQLRQYAQNLVIQVMMMRMRKSVRVQ